jgi:hypothetical protein
VLKIARDFLLVLRDLSVTLIVPIGPKNPLTSHVAIRLLCDGFIDQMSFFVKWLVIVIL